MTPSSVRAQVEEVISRLISSSLSVRQFPPSVSQGPGGATTIGSRQSSAIALRDIAYEDVYRELDSNDAYDAKLVDGGLLIFQYRFQGNGALLQHRLGYFPSPILPTIDDSPGLYEREDLYADVMARRLVRFPIRFDYAPAQCIDVLHPASHVTFGQYENCRVPVSGPLSPAVFARFIIRNFYHRAFRKHQNTFERRHSYVECGDTISPTERRILHMVCGR